MEMLISTDTNVHCNKSEPNEPSLWKITLQKRENSHVDTGTFIPPLTRFLYILLCGKSVPFYGREHFTFLRRQCFCYFLEFSFFTDMSRKFTHSRIFQGYFWKIHAGRMFCAPSPSLAHSGKGFKTKDLDI
jgi:hypothetical protein